MSYNLTILQNFVISKDKRFEVLEKDILPDISKFFKNSEFMINYNTNKNLDKVYKLYKNNVKNLTFYNDLTMDWGLTVQSMLQEVKTDYVFIFPEDFKLCNFDESYFDGLMKEIQKYKSKFTLMHRIEDVKNYGIDSKYFHLYDTKEYIHLTKGRDCPAGCMSSVAIYEKDFLNSYLNIYNMSEKVDRFPLSTPNCFEWYSANQVNTMFPNEQFAIPKRAVIYHHEPYDLKERV